ncbi:DNA gyrase subunit B [Maioricimonas rarisocia]|uniref:DNA topoisomerase (ATP-hydrolyzing) n=1 Tax=Maioricimonas rarisocia TaxID=2528026 RepID=A0A517YZT6_9PLAN|nr:DNA gyrase subunit B [Maioricimonas rarisocia]QDU35722.1 DNA gyrase subunit B [Maioricimonas rarisocia]
MSNETPNQPDSGYSEAQIRALEGIEGIRLRPDMYIGGTDLHGLHHLVYELVANSVDEAVNGYATTISVTIHGDGSCTVVDDGRGIPVGPMPDMENRSALEVVFTEIHAGGKFDRKSGYTVGTGGLHGVGITAVNACSEWLEAEVRRQGHVWTIEFREGVVETPLKKGGATDQTGTKITFKPDGTIFQTTSFSYDGLHKTLQDAAFLNAGLRIRISDERTGQSDEFHYEDGLVAFVQHLNRTETAIFPTVVHVIGEHTGDTGPVGVDVALQYNDGFSENIRCYCNGIYNSEGGTHLSGFRSALTRVLNNYGRKENIFKDIQPQGEDFREGLAAIITVRHPDPKFEAQTKIKLVNSDVAGIVESVVAEGLAKFLEENPSVAKAILNKGLRAAEAREAARKARDLARDKSKVTSGGLPEKLRDCRNHDLNLSELYLVEGDSAGGSADTGRDSATQAILPLRGKILNVEKAQLVKVLANTEVAAIFKAIGISPMAEEQDIAKRRYGKIILMTDADVDGSHIRTLLLTFIFRHMRELVKQGCVYVAQPPLYRVLSKTRKNQSPRYVQTQEEMMAELLELGLGGASLLIKPRANLLAERLEQTSEPATEARELSGEDLRKLAERMFAMEEPLEALERRGISLRRLAIDHASPKGMLPRYRVLLGSDEHWFPNKSAMEEFLDSEQEKMGRELKTADEEMRQTAGESGSTDAEAAGKQESSEGEATEEVATLSMIDLHEVRTINEGLRALEADFNLNLNDLLPAPPVNAEPVYPYEIIGHDSPYRLESLRDLVPKLREIGGRGLSYTRFKGLGEMNPNELFETAMDPENRVLKQVTLEDAAAAEEIFRVLMGDHVEPRREFIEKHALDVKDLDI